MNASYLFAAYSGMPVADVRRVAQQTFAIGPDIQHDRDRTGWINTVCRRIDGQLANRNFDAANAPIAEAQDLLGVRCDDQVDVVRSDG